MVLATADANGFPDARVVLLKEIDDGFVFYTNGRSTKGKELRERPQASLVLHWPALESQLRVRGLVTEVPPAMADAYWKSRPRESQLASAASEQSAPLESREVLIARLASLSEALQGKDVPRPPHWMGFRVVPGTIEFWRAGANRLHHREQWTQDGGETEWRGRLLNP